MAILAGFITSLRDNILLTDKMATELPLLLVFITQALESRFKTSEHPARFDTAELLARFKGMALPARFETEEIEGRFDDSD